MIDLIGILVACLLLWLAEAWILARTARAVGAKRASIGIGVLAVVILAVINIVINLAAMSVMSPISRASLVAVSLAAAVVELIIAYMAFRDLFGLSWKATFAPLGAMVGWSILVVALLLGVVRPWVVEAFVISTASMAPTANIGERIVVNKLMHPRRWDIVVYREPRDQSRAICRRLVGLPGEQLMFKTGSLYVNGQRVPAPAVLEGHMHAYFSDMSPAQGKYTDGQSIVLGPDECFLFGDNVENAADSRYYGPAKLSTLVGTADLM